MALVMSSRGVASVAQIPDSALGLTVFTTSKIRHSRLLPSSRVVASRTPPVMLARLMPVKLLTVPVLPPMLEREKEIAHVSDGDCLGKRIYNRLVLYDPYLISSGYCMPKYNVSRFSCTRP
jgi:hypothetical protein